VNHNSVKVAGGLQHILINDGYVIPISIRDCLPYVALYLFTDEEWDTLPNVILTGEADWDPGVLDLDLDDNETWFDAISDLPFYKPLSAFDDIGDYTKIVVVQSHNVLYSSWDTSQYIVSRCIPTRFIQLILLTIIALFLNIPILMIPH